MSAYKDSKTNKWYVFFYYRDFTGQNKGKTKRGFATKKEAQAWAREFLQQKTADLEMNFSSFVEVYKSDLQDRLKLNTWLTKESIIENKILPYFKDKQINDIKPADIIKWQNIIMKNVDRNGNKPSPTYLKTIHNQLSAIFNHAVRFYELKSNPAQKAGNMGKENGKEMLFWTKDEYLKFSDAMMDKPISFYAFEVLYWCGIRMGELLALTPKDFDFANKAVKIDKSYQRIKGEDIITEPKTPKSNRIIKMPDFLSVEMEEYIKSFYKIKKTDRIFMITKSYLHHEMDRGSTQVDVKRIRIHDIRHSCASLILTQGVPMKQIQDCVGHSTFATTADIYAHLDFNSKQISANAISSAFEVVEEVEIEEVVEVLGMTMSM